jgi:hypothetical protein
VPAAGRNDDVVPDDIDPMGVRPYFTGGTVVQPDSSTPAAFAAIKRKIAPMSQGMPVLHGHRPGQETFVWRRTEAVVRRAVAVRDDDQRRRSRYLLPAAWTIVAAVVAIFVALGMTSHSGPYQADRYLVPTDDPSFGYTGSPVGVSQAGKPNGHSAAPPGKSPAGNSDSSAGSRVRSGSGGAQTGLGVVPRQLLGLPVGSVTAQTPASGGKAAPQSSVSRSAPQSAATLHSLESVNYPGRYIDVRDSLGYLDPLSGTDSAQARKNATFTVKSGLADASCFSFMAADGSYLRHRDFRIHLDADDGSTLFKQDATFCPHPGLVSGSVSFESYNYPGRYLRHRNFELWIDPYDDSTGFRNDSSFRLDGPLG